LLAILRANLPPELLAAAWERGKALEFDAVIADLLNGETDSAQSVSLSTQPLPEALTERELEVLHLIADGYSNAEIAQKLFLAVATVKVHARHIFEKLGVASRTQAVAAARHLGLA
jgi:LuxR family maltose regulon positive regulatory protein